MIAERIETKPKGWRGICWRHGLINYKDTKTKCRHLTKISGKGDFAAGVY